MASGGTFWGRAGGWRRGTGGGLQAGRAPAHWGTAGALARRVRALCAAGALPMLACARRPLVVTAPTRVTAGSPGRAPHVPVRWYPDFWRALAAVDLKMAWVLADTPDERHLADALALAVDGDSGAVAAVTPLLAAPDALVRAAARVTYGALLAAASDWPRLAAFADSLATVTGTAPGDAAGVEAWAPAFRHVRPAVAFRDSVAVLPLTRARSGAPVVPVRVNGVLRHFWLDTGSSISILSSAAAAACGVTPARDTLELVTPVGRLPARPAVARTLQLGGARVHDVPTMVVDAALLRLHSGEATGAPGRTSSIDGVIGFDVIRALDVTIDDARARVVVRRPTRRPPDPRHPRTLFWFGVPIVTLTAGNGAPLHLALDTGAEESYGTRSFVVKTGAPWVPAERRIVHGFGGEAARPRLEAGLLVPSVRLFLGRTPLDFERVFLYDAQYPTIFDLDGTLGADVGRGGTVRIDMTNGRFEVRPR